MEIMKVFSSYDDYGYEDERLYSVLMTEDELVTLFSENKKKKRQSLSSVDSNKGLKRAILTSLPTGGGSLVGGYIAKNKADELDARGLSDDNILIGAKSHGGKIGALTGAAAGTAAAIKKGMSPVKAALVGLAGSGMGYIGGSQAAKVNTRHRLKKRSKLESKE